ncbi:MAG: SDR family oxidoreductase [Methylobacteriaceae bacterium]|nr:SDR family oxidoreductase [Methylobacteriaceae bacterium]
MARATVQSHPPPLLSLEARVLVLNGKVAIVTGAGSGIGRSMAMGLARAGARVVVNDIGVSLDGRGGSGTPAEETCDLIRAAGGEAAVSAHSVASWEEAQKIVAVATDAFGRLDIVVNNAGILRDQLFHKMDPANWIAVLDVHLNGSFFVSRAAAPLFREQESGVYIHMTSSSGVIGNVGQANYSAAKLGVVALSKSIALDMARFKVRSNCICPFAWGRMTQNIPAATPDQIARVNRLKQMTPEQNVPLAVYLASDEAASVTGQIFAVRANEIMLMGQSRPIRSVHRGEGWSPASVRDHAIPALRPAFFPLDRSEDVFSWEPV